MNWIWQDSALTFELGIIATIVLLFLAMTGVRLFYLIEMVVKDWRTNRRWKNEDNGGKAK